LSKTYTGEMIHSLINVAGKTGYPHVKAENRFLPFTLNKNQLKIKDLVVRPETFKLLQENRENTSGSRHRQ
jgi:hypothetical protein